MTTGKVREEACLNMHECAVTNSAAFRSDALEEAVGPRWTFSELKGLAYQSEIGALMSSLSHDELTVLMHGQGDELAHGIGSLDLVEDRRAPTNGMRGRGRGAAVRRRGAGALGIPTASEPELTAMPSLQADDTGVHHAAILKIPLICFFITIENTPFLLIYIFPVSGGWTLTLCFFVRKGRPFLNSELRFYY